MKTKVCNPWRFCAGAGGPRKKKTARFAPLRDSKSERSVIQQLKAATLGSVCRRQTDFAAGRVARRGRNAAGQEALDPCQALAACQLSAGSSPCPSSRTSPVAEWCPLPSTARQRPSRDRCSPWQKPLYPNYHAAEAGERSSASSVGMPGTNRAPTSTTSGRPSPVVAC